MEAVRGGEPHLQLPKLALHRQDIGFAHLGELVHGRIPLRDRTRSMRRRAHDIGAWLRRRSEDARGEVYAITAEMVTVAEAVATEDWVVAARPGGVCVEPATRRDPGRRHPDRFPP
ncbi:MAG: hypothetical protein ACRDY7_00070 [Acidimicrobiia bacterium]